MVAMDGTIFCSASLSGKDNSYSRHWNATLSRMETQKANYMERMWDSLSKRAKMNGRDQEF